MTDETRSISENPFDPAHPPFAGRQPAFARLHQHLLDPSATAAVAYVGRPRTGKTMLLRSFGAVFDEHAIGIYIALDTALITDEAGWLRLLYRAAVDEIAGRAFNTRRLPEVPEAAENWRVWLKDTALPEALRVIRPHRKLVFLLDNAEALVGGPLPQDHPAYLASLLGPQVGMALTLTDEGAVLALSPLVNVAEPYRLPHLTETETAALFPGTAPAVITTVQRLSGGHPQLVQALGYHLLARKPFAALVEQDLRAVIAPVMAEHDALFRQMWAALDRNARMTLTAVISLVYADPLSQVTAEQIEAWLVRTDFPMDLTTIHAALRRLEYDEILVHSWSGVVIGAGLMQTWLMENARLDVPQSGAVVEQHRALWIAVTLAVLLALFVAAAVFSAQETASGGENQPPTVTLAPQG